MLKKFGLEDSKPMKTPMSTKTKLTKDEEGESVDNTKYKEDPKTSHLEAVKRIFRYIKGTTHLGLWYPKGSGIETIVYANSDHAGDYVDRKRTSGICTFMGCCLTSWFSKKQTALAIFQYEANSSARKACQQALWMKQALFDYGISLDDILIMIKNGGKRVVQNSAWFKEKMLLAQVQEAGIALSKEQLAILVDTGDRVDSLPYAHSLTTNPIFQPDGIDLYDSDCDDISTAKAVLMANLSSYGSNDLSEVSDSETYQNDMANHSVHAMQNFKQTPVVDFLDNEITSDSNIIPYS
ncbi:hypothetical protein Tco_0210773 [Tanacetum coccineum]